MPSARLIKLILFVLYGTLAYLCVYLEYFSGSKANVSISIILISIGLGIAAQLIFDWGNTKPATQVFWNAFTVIVLMCVVMMIFAFETIACVLIGLPIIGIFMAVGLTIVRRVNDMVNTRFTQCISIFALPLAAVILSPVPMFDAKSYQVTTQTEMVGSAAEIMTLTANVPTIADHERPWTITHNIIGAPRPLSAKVIDGVRYASWEKGVHFQEIMTGFSSENSLSWTFHFPDISVLGPIDYNVSPTGPEVFMDRGSYQLTPLPNGNTRVTLTTEYRLNTPMNWYYAAWGKLFLNDFHNAVLHVLANRAATGQT